MTKFGIEEISGFWSESLCDAPSAPADGGPALDATLVNNSFQNWRGMQESGGRRVNKNIFLDMTTLKFCTPDMLDNIRKEVPLMADYQPAEAVSYTHLDVYKRPKSARLYLTVSFLP